jgi:hypothetical protein
MNYNTMAFFSSELVKLAFGEKEHRALAGIQASPALGYGKSVRNAIQSGSLRVDTGMTNPENPASLIFFNRAHSTPFLDKGEFGKNIVQQQKYSRDALVRAARTEDPDALAEFAAHAGRLNHMGVDDLAHNRKGLEKGYALKGVRNSPIARKIPGAGWATEGAEHLLSNQAASGKNPSIRAAVSSVLSNLGKGKSPFDETHNTDKLTGTLSDAKAIERSKRLGSATKKQAIAQLMREDGLDAETAKKMVDRAINMDVDPSALAKAQSKAETRFAVGEVKRRLKKNPLTGSLISGIKKLL